MGHRYLTGLRKQWSRKKFNSLNKKKRLLEIASCIRDAEQFLINDNDGRILMAKESYNEALLYLNYLDVTLPPPMESLLYKVKESITAISIEPNKKHKAIRKLNDIYYQILKIADKKISDYDFIVQTKDDPSRATKSEPWPIYIILDNLRSPFNIGSIFRTADAVRITKLILCGYTAAPPNKRLDRSSMGATNYITWQHFDRTEDAIASLKDKNIPIIGLDTISNAKYHFNFEFPKPSAIVVGNEELGISWNILEQCDYHIQIPQYGYKNSINVSCATSIILYEILRQYLI